MQSPLRGNGLLTLMRTEVRAPARPIRWNADFIPITSFCWYIDLVFPGSENRGYVASKLSFGGGENPEKVDFRY